jgi:GTP-binding protein
MIINNSQFLKSASSMNGLPEDGLPEFAFIGRSNVGKSSLLNMVLGRSGLVKTSKKPGKTILINYFLVNDNFFFVDLPGYGFAHRSKASRNMWQRLIEQYLVERKELTDIFLLIDSRHGVMDNDGMMIDFLDHYNIPFTPIFTKTDKLNKNALAALKQKNPECFFTSAENGLGREELLDYIESLIT